MKTRLLILIIACSLISTAQISAQDEKIAPQAWGVGENLSEKEQQEILKDMPEKTRQDLEFIKKTNKSKYFRLLNNYRFKNLRIFNLSSSLSTGSLYRLDDERGKRGEVRDARDLDLDIETEALALKYKNDDGTNKQKIKTELKARLAELFELKENDRRKEVQELEKKLDELKKSLDLRAKNKEEVINRRILELLGESDYYRW